MPELPDVELYLSALRQHYQGETIQGIVVKSPFVIRSTEVPIETCEGKRIEDFWRMGKRILWQLTDDHFIVFHLMISGRYHKRRTAALPRSKADLVAFQFPDSTLMLTEAASKKRASLHIVAGKQSLRQFERGGLDVMACDQSEFAQRLKSTNQILKRALTDPVTFDGIGNAYSDEILHHARLSPFARTASLTDNQIAELFNSTRSVLGLWIERLRQQNGDAFPEKVTAFRPEMAVHGKFRSPCPDCLTPVQRIRFADKEWNYCPTCQTKGKLLADRSLSRLLHSEWPDSVDDLE